jgi:biopolymer transport protein ExbD
MSRRDHQQKSDSKITLPITPMLDMTFQLLFFFMLSFNPAPVEGAVDMALPSGDHRPPPGQRGRPGPPPAPAFDADLTVKVRTQMDGTHDGMITSVSVARLEAAEDVIRPGEATNPRELEAGLLAELQKYLKAKRAGAQGENAGNLKLQGDGRLHVGSIVSVMDVCRKAGFDNISFIPPDER